ncbi:Hypothetical protein PBC10988_23730 [Planctomycetales bacterium 10988]|nr:Hypothetical protein PBC10988_23730 [Planctomycetales bacterium 10988]
MNSKSSFCYIALSVLLSLLASSLLAQTKADRPRLILNTEGASGTIRCLAFSPDSQRLHAAGLDKVVSSWYLQRDGRGRFRPVFIGTTRWEIGRAERGLIYTMAASPDNQSLAVAGYAARSSNGDIALLDGSRRVLQQTLPLDRSQSVERWPGHLKTVVSLDYSPNGQQLASLDRSGELRLWKAPDWQSTVLRTGEATENDFQKVLFLDNERLVVAERNPNAQGAYGLALYNTVQGRRIGFLSETHTYGISALAKSPNGKRWVSADAAGRIYLWTNTTSPQSQTIRGMGNRAASSLSLTDRGQLAVANFLDRTSNQGILEWWQVDPPQRLDQLETSKGEHSWCCAVSPDGKQLAAANSNRHTIYLFQLNDEQGQPLARPLSTRREFRQLQGSGTDLWKVAFEETSSQDKGYRIGLATSKLPDGKTNRLGEIELSFDLSDLRLRKPILPNTKWHLSSQSPGPGDWRLQNAQGGEDLFLADRIRLLSQGRPQGEIQLNPDKQGRVFSWCWIPDAVGQPFAVAIGTTQVPGIFVYSLPTAGPPKLLRYFRDHSGDITSLAVSPDGRYLASCSRDQTAKIWSLAGLQLPADRPFQAEPAWGAQFEIQNGQLKVGDALDAGITIGRGMLTGDTITKVIYPRTGLPGQNYSAATDPQEMLKALETTPLFESLAVYWNRGGQEDFMVLTPAWEPLATLFLNRRLDWAMWTPEGYFNASAAEGDQLFGWQINQTDPGQPPRILKAAELRGELEKPEVLKALLKAGSVPQALQQIGQRVPLQEEPIVQHLAEKKLPQIRLLEPGSHQTFESDETIKITAYVEPPAGRKLEEFQVQAYIANIPLGEALSVVEQGNGFRIQWQTKPQQPMNRIEIRIEEKVESAQPLYAETFVEVAAKIVDQPPVFLHVLAIACDEYQDIGDWAPLDYAVGDADSLVNVIKAHDGRHYHLGKVIHLTNSEVSPEAVEQAIETLGSEIRSPQDIICFIAAGHGYAFDSDYYFIPTSLTRSYRSLLEEKAISWQLIRRLGELRCRKVAILDTCHAGNIQLDLGKNSKQVIRETRDLRFMVLAATDVDQESLEYEEFFFDGKAHGLFTMSLLEGLSGFADQSTGNQDNIVELNEIAEYTVQRVQQEIQKQNSIILEQFKGFSREDLLEYLLDQTPKFTRTEDFVRSQIPLISVE